MKDFPSFYFFSPTSQSLDHFENSSLEETLRNSAAARFYLCSIFFYKHKKKSKWFNGFKICRGYTMTCSKLRPNHLNTKHLHKQQNSIKKLGFFWLLLFLQFLSLFYQPVNETHGSDVTHSPQRLFPSRLGVDMNWAVLSNTRSLCSTSAVLQTIHKTKRVLKSSGKHSQLQGVLTLGCQRPLIPLSCKYSASAAKELRLQKLMWSAAAAISRQRGRIDHPTLWILSDLETRPVSLQLSSLLLMLPLLIFHPFLSFILFFGGRLFTPTHAHACRSARLFQGATIFIYWSQMSSEAHKK